MATTQKKRKSSWISPDQWEAQRRSAQKSFYRSRDAYFEKEGLTNFTRWHWEHQREEAKAQAVRARKEKLDSEFIAAIKEKTVAIRTEEGQFTRAQAAVLIAIINIVTTTAALYASEESIAKAAKVSKRSVTYAMRWLEDAWVLIRRKSGGINLASGKRASNNYKVSYDVLRDLLGMDQIPMNGYFTVEATIDLVNAVKTPYWSYEQYCRYSSSARADRRRRQRADEIRRLRFVQQQIDLNISYDALIRHYKIDADPVENVSDHHFSSLVENSKDQAIYLEFCALTNLKIKKIHIELPSELSFLRLFMKPHPKPSKPTLLTYFIDTLFPNLHPLAAASSSENPNPIDKPKNRHRRSLADPGYLSRGKKRIR